MYYIHLNKYEFLQRATIEAIKLYNSGQRKFVAKFSDDAPIEPKDVTYIVEDGSTESYIEFKEEGE